MFNHKNMEYRHLGNTGLKVSVISLGNMVNSAPDRVEIDDAIIGKCLEGGINFFDTAEAYVGGECEKALGRALIKHNVNRSDVVITTKIHTTGKSVNSTKNTNRKHVTQSLDASLSRLQLDYVDVLFAHLFDEVTPMQEICRAFNKAIEDGKALYWATSNWSAENVYQAFGVCDRLGLHRPIADQCQYNMLVRKVVQVEYETLFDKHNYGTTVWSPLAGGFLTGKYLEGIPEGSRLHSPTFLTADLMKKFFYEPYNNPKTFAALKELQLVAKDLNASLAQLAIAWVLKNPNVSTAITGASSVEQVESNLASLEVYKKITPQIQRRINSILDTTPKPKFNWGSFCPGIPRRAEEAKPEPK